MKLFAFHHHQNSNPWESARPHELELREMLSLIIKNQELLMSAIDDLTAQVAANKTVVDSALVLIQGIAARITAAGTDPAALAALTDSLKSEDDALAAAVAANTPAPPAA